MRTNEYRLGLVSVSFRQHTPREIIEAVKREGLSCIEWGSDVHAPCRDTARLREIAGMQKEYGVVCSSYGTYFRLGQTPIGELEDYIGAAKMLGTDILRFWCGTKSGGDLSDRERQALTEQCKTAAQMAEREGVTLCMECHKDTYTQRPEDALSLMREINSPHFRMYWQPFQWQTAEENLAYAGAIAQDVVHVHVFHWKDRQRLPLNEGIGEWQSYLRKLPAPRTLLLEFMPNDRLSELPAEAKALKTMIGE